MTEEEERINDSKIFKSEQSYSSGFVSENGNSKMYSLHTALTIISVSNVTPLYHINNIGNQISLKVSSDKSAKLNIS